MRKITLFLMLFCMFVGTAWAQTVITDVAQLKNDKVYTIIPKHDVRGAMYATATTTHLDACGGTYSGAKNPGIAVDANSSDQQFALYTHEGSTYLYSIGAGKYVSDVSGKYFPLVEKPGYPVAVVNSDTEGYFTIKVKGTEFINVSTGWDYGCVGGWNTTDDGNRLLITEVADIPADALAKLTADFSKQVELTYVYKTGAKEWKRETVVAEKGAAYPAPASVFGVTFTTLPEGNVPAETVNGAEVIVECVIEGLPFNVSTLTDGEFGEGMSWYYLKMREKDVTYDAGTGKALTGNVDKKGVNNLFAFTGNPFEGFSIYNFAAGSKKVFWIEDATNAGRVFFTEISETDGNTWMLSKNGDAGYVFRLNGHDTGYMNDHQPEIAIWNSSWGATDGGSTFKFEYVENPDFGGVEDLQAYIAEVNAYIATGVANGNTVGYITEESAQQVEEALAAANTAVENRTGCIEALTVLKTAIANVKFIQPEEGKFYKIVSSCTKDHRAGQDIYVNNDGNMHFAKADDYGFGIASAMSRVWQFVPASDGKFYIKNVERGVFMQSVGTATETDGTKAKAVTISNMGKNNVVSIKPDGQSQMHAQDNNSKIVGWNENNPEDGSAWIITEVSIDDYAHTLNVTSAEWATLVLGYNAEIPEGVTVYAVSELNENAATLTEVKNAIPAGAAVLINAAEGAYVFNYAESADAIGANLLKGTTVNANIADASYVLGNIVGVGVGFYTATFNVNTDTSNDIVEGEGESAVTTPVNDAFKNNAFKAYLPKTNNAAQTLRFNFGETTGIEGVIEGTNANTVIFDLSGRRVAKMQKGIYIVNGKKVYVK